jgi:hypothetical protein
MVTTAFIVAGVVLVLVLAVVYAFRSKREKREKREKRVVVTTARRHRAHDLEARIRTVLTGPRQKYGDIFTDYAVWRYETETRLELVAGPPWKKLNEFTRCLIVRYLWRVLESLAGGAVVIVDDPQQTRNDEVDSGFRDQGFDWKTFGMGPQFINEP